MGGRQAPGEARRARRRHRQAGTKWRSRAQPGLPPAQARLGGSVAHPRLPVGLPKRRAQRVRIIARGNPRAATGRAPQNEADGTAVQGRRGARAASVAPGEPAGRTARPASRSARGARRERRTPVRVGEAHARRSASSAPLIIPLATLPTSSASVTRSSPAGRDPAGARRRRPRSSRRARPRRPGAGRPIANCARAIGSSLSATWSFRAATGLNEREPKTRAGRGRTEFRGHDASGERLAGTLYRRRIVKSGAPDQVSSHVAP